MCRAPPARLCELRRARLAAAKFCPECAHPVGKAAAAEQFAAPERYTPKHLAEKILTSKTALEGERKQVTVLFADLKGSMELLADRDPEEARKLLDPVLERMMEAVHRYEGTVNQVMGDGIMALFGAPLAHEDHAVRACYAALRMQEAVTRYAEEVCAAPRASRCRSASGSTPARSSCARSAATCTWTTRRSARPRTWPRAWSSWRRRAPSCSPPTRCGWPRATCRSSRSGPVPVKGLPEPVEVFELIGAGRRARACRRPRRAGSRASSAATPRSSSSAKRWSRPARATARSSPWSGEPGVGKSRLV